MIRFAFAVFWMLSLISSIWCAIIGFIGMGMGGGLSYYPIILIASPFAVVTPGIVLLRAESRLAVLILNALLLAPIVQCFLFFITI